MNSTTQQLLEGERIAQRIIKSAKDERASKIREAQFEAKTEIELIKKKMNEQFEELVEQKEKETSELKAYEDQAKEEVREIRLDFEANKQKVVDLLLQSIMNINLTLPKVVIGNFEDNIQL